MLRPIPVFALALLSLSTACGGGQTQPAPVGKASPPKSAKSAQPNPAQPASPPAESPSTTGVKWPDGVPPHLTRDTLKTRGLASREVDSLIFSGGKYVLDHTAIETFDEHGEILTRRSETPARKVTSAWEITYERAHLPKKSAYTTNSKTHERSYTYEFDQQKNLLRTTALTDDGKTLVDTIKHGPDGTYRVVHELQQNGKTEVIGHDLYNRQGLRIKKCPPTGDCASYTYDAHGNLIGEQPPEGEAKSFEIEVDAEGRELAREDPPAAWKTTYDDQGRPSQVLHTSAGKAYEKLVYRYTLRTNDPAKPVD